MENLKNKVYSFLKESKDYRCPRMPIFYTLIGLSSLLNIPSNNLKDIVLELIKEGLVVEHLGEYAYLDREYYDTDFGYNFNDYYDD